MDYNKIYQLFNIDRDRIGDLINLVNSITLNQSPTYSVQITSIEINEDGNKIVKEERSHAKLVRYFD